MAPTRRWGGVFRVTDLEVELQDEDFGDYVVPGLKVDVLTPAVRTVKVLPRGGRVLGVVSHGNGRVIGARGRVDLVSGPAKAIILRFIDGGTHWKILTQTAEPADLTTDRFAEVLSELVE